MSSRYRRVKWSVEVDPDFVFHEGWFHGFSPNFLETLVEKDDGDLVPISTCDISFITPPNADMYAVCGDCGRVMENEDLGLSIGTFLACTNPTCPSKEAQNENG